MRLANGLQIGLDVAQRRHARLQLVHRFVRIHLDTGLVGLGLGASQEPKLLLLERAVSLQRVELAGHLGLLFQLVQIGVELAQDVFHAGQVFARVGQAVFRLAAAFFVLGNPSRFFQEQAQLFGFGFDDAADRALADDGVSAWAQARTQEHVLHIAPAHRLVVEVVAAGAVTREHPLDGNLGELAPLATGTVIRVVKNQLHAGPAGGLADVGAIENHVLHGLATQLTGAAFAQHPAHGVHDVGLAAAVRPDHAHQLPRQHEVGGLGKGLEAR